MKIKSGVKYRILCEYQNSPGELLKAGDVVEAEKVICWGGAGTWTRYGLVFFKDSFPIFAHIFEMIAEEEDPLIEGDTPE
jgi:hypothetical protein